MNYSRRTKPGEGSLPVAQIRIVSWIDSSLQNGQVGKDDYPTPELIRSVGFVVEETSEHVTLARDDMKDDEYRGLICIPKECIRG